MQKYLVISKKSSNFARFFLAQGTIIDADCLNFRREKADIIRIGL